LYSEKRINEKALIESGIDTDWYFMDNSGKIAIVASGGGLLPESVSSDMGRLTRMIKYFRSLPVLSNDIIIENRVLKSIKTYNEKQKDIYLSDLYFMATRGFYYFDKMISNNYSDFRYFLKAKPTIPLIIDKNTSVLPFTFINGNLENIKYFEANKMS